MSTLPPSPFINSAAVVMPAPEQAAAPSPLPTGGAAAEPIAEPSPVTSALADFPLDDTDDIHEIFYYARKLARDRRFVLDEQAFMDAIDEPPLFLQAAAE